VRRRAVVAVLATVLAVAVLTGCRPEAAVSVPDAPPGAAVAPNAVVERVVDGDTLEMRISGATHTVRLIGIDTPETVDPRRPVGCYGPEASARTAELLPAGTAVQLQLDAEPRDNFGRLLVYAVRSSDGLLVNLDLARSGHAEALSIEPNTVHAGTIATAAGEARAAGRGLWGACRDP
jgi:micrococcal nuclease